MRPAIVVLALAACSGSGESKATSGAPPSAKRTQCERSLRFVVDFSAALSLGVADKLGGDTSAFVTCMRDHPGDATTCLADPKLKAQIAKAVEECTLWPDEVVRCMSEPELLRSPACMRAFEQWQGLASSEPQSDGPPPRWQLALGFDAVHAIGVGTTIVVGGDQDVAAIAAGGKLAWRATVPAGFGLVAIARERCVLAVGPRELACLALADGEVAWRAQLPPPIDKYSDEVTFTAAAEHAGTIVLATSTRAMYAATPRACKQNPPACLALAGEIADGTGAEAIAILPSGQRVLRNITRLFITDARGAPRAALASKMLHGFTVEPTGTLLVASDTKLLRIDPATCKTRDDELAEIEQCGTPLHVFDGEPGAPILVDGALITTVSSQLHRLGAPGWKVELGLMSAPLVMGTKLHILAQDGAGAKLELRAIDPTSGKTTARSWLPLTTLGRAAPVVAGSDLVVLGGGRAFGFAAL